MHRFTVTRLLVGLIVVVPLVILRPSAAVAIGHATYHGGQVASTSTTFAIFWLPSGTHFETNADDSRYESTIEQYFKDVGGTPYYKTLTQYSRDKRGRMARGGPIRNISTFGGAYVDTTPYPHAGTQSDPLLGSDIRDTVSRAMKANSWPAGITHQYFVYTAAGTQICDLPLTLLTSVPVTSRVCTFSSTKTLRLCADRGYFSLSGRPVLYAVVPSTVDSHCQLDPNLGPNRDPHLDLATFISSSFLADAVVDPVGTGWYHINAWSGSIGICDDVADVSLHGRTYMVSTLWSNAQNRCVVRNPPPRRDHLPYGTPSYHNGSVMPSTTTYTIFWLPPGAHFESDGPDVRYEGLMNRFLTDVGGTPYYNILTQYSRDDHGHPVKNGPIGNTSVLGGSVVDTAPYPRTGTVKDPLQAQDLEAEIARMMRANNWTPGPDKMYFIFTGAGMNLCDGDPTVAACTFKTDSPMCAYHRWFLQDDQPVIYGAQPDWYSLDMCRNFHAADVSPNDDVAADTEVSALAHELFEAVTDPMSFGWKDIMDSSEIGDKCQRDFGTPDPTDGANVTLHGDRYVVQSQWSNATFSCELAYP